MDGCAVDSKCAVCNKIVELGDDKDFAVGASPYSMEVIYLHLGKCFESYREKINPILTHDDLWALENGEIH
jgi:hypothetical protein